MELILKQNTFIILSYLCLQAISVIQALAYPEIHRNYIFSLICLLIYSIVGIYAIKGNKYATVIIALCILFTGTMMTIVGIFVMNNDQLIMRISCIFLGPISLWGAVKLILSVRLQR